MKTLATLVAVMMAVGGAAVASSTSATASAPVAVSLIKPITLKKASDLWFGHLLIEGESGALEIRQTAGDGGGGRSPDPSGVTQLATASSLWHNARFEVAGQAGLGFTVAVTGHPIVIQNATFQSMVVALNYYCSDTVIDPSGSTVWVGGRLSVPNNPRPGRYTGEFEVTVAYY